MALKMMQKEVINKSGVFPYVQMEKEVYYLATFVRHRLLLNISDSFQFSDSEKL